MRKLAFLLAVICCYVNAEEIYKWTDANGKIHFGDRSAAPSDGKKMDVKVQQSNRLSADQSDQTKPQSTNLQSRFLPPSAPQSRLGLARKSVPADSAKVGPRCKDLIDEIAKVKPGTPWTSLYKEFNEACPGIAYECTNYRTHPENNNCTWVERSGTTVLQTKNYE
jgi:hypothetical protein